MKKINIHNIRMTRIFAILMIIALILVFILNVHYLKSRIYDTTNTNTQAVTEQTLSVNQTGYMYAVDNYYPRALNTTQALSSDVSVINNLNTKQVGSLTADFQHELNHNIQIDSFAGYDVNGNVIALATSSGNGTLIASNFNQLNPVLQKSLSSRKLNITDEYLDFNKHLVVSFVAPVFDQSGVFYGNVVGTVTVKVIAEKTNFPIDSKNYGNSLIDSSGDIMIINGTPQTKLTKVGSNEPIISKLLVDNQVINTTEINYYKKPSLTQGSRLSYNGAGHVYIISYAYQCELQNRVTATYNTYYHSYVQFASLNGFFIGITLFTLALILRMEEK